MKTTEETSFELCKECSKGKMYAKGFCKTCYTKGKVRQLYQDSKIKNIMVRFDTWKALDGMRQMKDNKKESFDEVIQGLLKKGEQDATQKTNQ